MVQRECLSLLEEEINTKVTPQDLNYHYQLMHTLALSISADEGGNVGVGVLLCMCDSGASFLSTQQFNSEFT
jgi:hypothetical protein